MKNILLFMTAILISPLTFAHGLIYDTGQYDQTQFSADMHQCEQLSHQTGNAEADGALRQGAKTGLLLGATGAAVGSISGNSGSSAAKTGAAVGVGVGMLGGRANRKATERDNAEKKKNIVRSCMSGRGYASLN
jgi:hypothetical protein